jgi:hypothetical protein
VAEDEEIGVTSAAVGTHFPNKPLGDKCDGSAKTREVLDSPGGKNDEEDEEEVDDAVSTDPELLSTLGVSSLGVEGAT